MSVIALRPADLLSRLRSEIEHITSEARPDLPHQEFKDVLARLQTLQLQMRSSCGAVNLQDALNEELLSRPRK